MINFLAIDCSLSTGQIFLKKHHNTFLKKIQSTKYLNDTLMTEILNFLQKHDVRLNTLSEVYINVGPGNFTGLRGSLATAKGICLANNIQLIAYDNFIWTAFSAKKNLNRLYSLFQFRDRYFIQEFNNYKKKNFPKNISIYNILNFSNKRSLITSKEFFKNFDKNIKRSKKINLVTPKFINLQVFRENLVYKKKIRPIYL